MRLDATELTPAERALQQDVCDWLDERLPEGSYPIGLGIAGAVDPEFSRDLGAQGWLGMSLPPEFGGHGRTAVDRLVVVEALLARGAPVGYHWIGDRQMGPSIAANGTDQLKKEILPGIASGELSFSIGMSEPDAGSDLASGRTRAERVEGGWRVNGAKIWTSGAGAATHILALLRTSDDRHGGLTQFVVDRHADGLTVAPIKFIDGSEDFCELSFVDVLVPDERRPLDVAHGAAGAVGRPGADGGDLVGGRRPRQHPGTLLGAARHVARDRAHGRRRPLAGHRGRARQGDGYPLRAGVRGHHGPSPGPAAAPGRRRPV